eukprot:5420362-Ditylum_brightwellii.AAC.1
MNLREESRRRNLAGSKVIDPDEYGPAAEMLVDNSFVLNVIHFLCGDEVKERCEVRWTFLR